MTMNKAIYRVQLRIHSHRHTSNSWAHTRTCIVPSKSYHSVALPRVVSQCACKLIDLSVHRSPTPPSLVSGMTERASPIGVMRRFRVFSECMAYSFQSLLEMLNVTEAGGALNSGACRRDGCQFVQHSCDVGMCVITFGAQECLPSCRQRDLSGRRPRRNDGGEAEIDDLHIGRFGHQDILELDLGAGASGRNGPNAAEFGHRSIQN